ncbi:MAG: cyclic nucleotide-binding domain-containing protein [Candidatus Glassbacteria bacterium]
MDQARSEQILNELQTITRIMYSGSVGDIKSSATLLVKNIKAGDRPFIKKDAPGHALYYIVEGKAGVDIGQPERIEVPAKRTVGEMSMISMVINSLDNLMAVESRSADVYAEGDMRLIVFNYSALVEILQNPNPALRKLRGQLMISLNRIMYRKLMEVNENYVNVLIAWGLAQEAEEVQYPIRLVEGIGNFLKKMRSIPNLSVKPHELRGTIIREGEPNSDLIFMHEGRVKISKLHKNQLTQEEQRIDLNIQSAPTIIGESSILNVGSQSVCQVDTITKVFGYRISVQALMRHLQHYPEMFEQIFQFLLELNYFRTLAVMKRTTSL